MTTRIREVCHVVGLPASRNVNLIEVPDPDRKLATLAPHERKAMSFREKNLMPSKLQTSINDRDFILRRERWDEADENVSIKEI